MPFPAFPPSLPLNRPGLSRDERQAEASFLDAVQGNILKGHGRDHQRLVFFRFPSGVDRARAAARAAATYDRERHMRPWIRSALEQYRQRSLRYRAVELRRQYSLQAEKWAMAESQQDVLQRLTALEDQVVVQYFSGLLLSRSGLEALGISPEEKAALHGSLETGMAAGMQGPLMGGSVDLSYWTKPYTEDFHGIFLLACKEEKALDEQLVPALKAWCGEHDISVWEEHIEPGCTWRDEGNPYGNGYHPPREPFGFVDGISMPQFFHEDREPAVRTPGTPPAWHSIDLQLENVFVRDGPLRGGSYVALLKLEQDVQGFREHEVKIVERLRACGFAADVAADLAPALIMGRNRHGHTPAQVLRSLPVPAGTDQNASRPPHLPAWLNEFDFEETRQSAGCPFHAHIRKSNPRAMSPTGLDKHAVGRVQPVRRGMIFDPARKLAAREAANTGAWPGFGDGVGLLFLAYMADPWTQFDQWHNTWARDTAFPTYDTANMDPVLFGHSEPVTHCGADQIPPLPPVVRRLGGAYLFAPAIHWLENLPTP
ncbi:Dyp-type peroxidase [Lacunisphaera limnophila]|nr:hypothetical protein [Lacunisphaera limnophila]